jgi:hypothetical protein
MDRYWLPVIALSVILLGASTMNSTAYLSEQAPLCANWEQACARLWGDGTRHYRQCMRQPQAIRDCQWTTSLAPTIFAVTGSGSARACTVRNLGPTELA